MTLVDTPDLTLPKIAGSSVPNGATNVEPHQPIVFEFDHACFVNASTDPVCGVQFAFADGGSQFVSASPFGVLLARMFLRLRGFAGALAVGLSLAGVALMAGCGTKGTNRVPVADAGAKPDGGKTDAGPVSTDAGGQSDAGPDGGMVTDSGADAGSPDGGQSDAGLADAGNADAGTDGGGMDGGVDAGPTCSAPDCLDGAACIAAGACASVAGSECVAGTLVSSCGDGQCDCGETSATCPSECAAPCAAPDCSTTTGCIPAGTCGAATGTICSGGDEGNSCGNGTCDCGETQATCPADCGCPSGTCPFNGGCIGQGQCAYFQVCTSSGALGSACGDGICDCGETAASCTSGECSTAACANGGCHDAAGACVANGTCLSGTPGMKCSGGLWNNSCGDGSCNCGESQAACPKDCGGCPAGTCTTSTGSCLGDGQCSGSQRRCDGSTGLSVATCGNGVCDCGEDPATCPDDCACGGPGACIERGKCFASGSCSPTVAGEVCHGGVIQQSCGDGVCNCGDTCANCPGDCGACQPTCGNGSCDVTETCDDCPLDCRCLSCPPTTCTPSQVCCEAAGLPGTCGASCSYGYVTKSCDTSAQCPAGDVCCAHFVWPSAQASCLASCGGYVLCRSVADCPAGQGYTECQPCGYYGETWSVCTKGAC